MEAIFRLANDDIGLTVLELTQFLGRQPYRWKQVTGNDLVHRIRKAWQWGNLEATADLLSLLALIAFEPEQRELVARKSSKRLRNIKLGGNLVNWHLRRVLATGWRRNQEEGELFMEDGEFDSIVAAALGPIKVKLGLPPTNTVAYSYPVSDEVVGSAEEPELRKYLLSQVVIGSVMFGQIDDFCNEVRRICPVGEADKVIKVLLAGETREHLSALSLSSKSRYSWVSIVNPKGVLLTMPARKFEALISCAGQSRLVGMAGTKGFESGLPEVEINAPIPVDQVTGYYEAKTSVLYIACLSAQTLEVQFRAEFVLDTDTVVCMYLAMRRQRLDRQRLERLMDEAETKVAVDPYRHLYTKEVNL